jgi:hypothetical protein
MHGLVQTRPPFIARRCRIDDKKARAMRNEIGRNTLVGLVRVNQGPDKWLELGLLKIRRHLVDTFFNVQVAELFVVQYDWLSFSEASA